MAGNCYCIMRIEKIKNLIALGRAYNHNYRTTRSAAPNSFEELRDRNQELIDDNFGIDDHNFVNIYRRRILESDFYKTHNVRKNAVVALEILLSYSKEQEGNFDIDKWKTENVKWLKETFGTDNVISAMFHDDEKDLADSNGTGRHIHAIILPFDEKGCLNANKYIGGRTGLRDKQTEYANRMAIFGLVRGEAGKHDRYLSPAIYRKRVDEQLLHERQYIPVPNEGELASEYVKRLEQPLWQIARDHTDTILDLERELYRKRRKEELKRKKKEIDDELKGLKNDN